jgi:hypothetical protein
MSWGNVPRIVTVRRNIEGLTGAIDVTKGILAQRKADGLNTDAVESYLEHCERELAKRKNELARLEKLEVA